MEHEGDGDTNCGESTWNNTKRTSKRIEGVGNKTTGKDHPNSSRNVKKNPGELRRLVTQALVRNHQLTLVGKTQMR